MNSIVITARSNPKIKELKELTSKPGARRSAGVFVCDGVRLCKDAVRSGREIISVFITESCKEKYSEDTELILSAAENVYYVSGDVMKSVSDTVSPQGIICTVKQEKNEFEIKEQKKYIALDSVQNPDNLGAIIRTAEALGIDGIIISGGCDIYNPKALRASMGSTFRMRFLVTDNLPGEIEKCNAAGISTYASVVTEADADITAIDFSDGALVVIGNEGNGVSRAVKDACQRKITIVMKGRAESMNASQASSIIMWEMTK